MQNTPTASLPRGKIFHNECSRYDTKQSDSEVSVMLEFWGMQSTPSLQSFPGPPQPGVVASDRILSMGQIELSYVFLINWIVWNWSAFVCKTDFYEMERFWTSMLYVGLTDLFELELFDLNE